MAKLNEYHGKDHTVAQKLLARVTAAMDAESIKINRRGNIGMPPKGLFDEYSDPQIIRLQKAGEEEILKWIKDLKDDN